MSSPFSRLLLVLLISSAMISYETKINAQVVPDSSLGSESSIVTPNVTVRDAIADLIEGGAIRGENLFQSFSEFNISEGGRVFFANPDGISNIFTRVTGGNSSNILGTLGVDGNANLFLLNPQGIIFGANSSLDLRGSFLATTAESYLFNNGFEFSALNPEQPPLLTIDIPIGLQFGSQAATITNQSVVSENPQTIVGLEVPTEQTISLIGGDVDLEGGFITTESGNIEIGAVAPNSKVDLIANARGWQSDFSAVTSFQDITLTQAGEIQAGNSGGSNITLTGRNISLGQDLETVNSVGVEIADFFTLSDLPNLANLPTTSVRVTATNQNNATPSRVAIAASETFSIINGGDIAIDTFGTGDSGTLDINAETIIFFGGGFAAGTTTGSSGNAGNVNFTANNISIQNGGGGINTNGSGNGGQIILNVADNVNFRSAGFGANANGIGNGGLIQINADNLTLVSSGLGADSNSSGDGGTIDINLTNNLIVNNGGIGADSNDTGRGGTIEIDAQNIDVDGGGFGVDSRSVGEGGDLTIRASDIKINNGAIGADSSFINAPDNIPADQVAGEGGEITIQADSLALNNSEIFAVTSSPGDAGDINIEVDSLELTGENGGISNTTNSSGDSGDINITADNILVAGQTGIKSNSEGSGQAGDVLITSSNSLQIQDEGEIAIASEAPGSSGNIVIAGDNINLQDAGRIANQTSNGSEGNIDIEADTLFLSDSAEITTDATQNATGGNITLDIDDTLVNSGSSQIVANADDEEVGNLSIFSRGIFNAFASEINASSRLTFIGETELSNLTTDLNASLDKLPQKIANSGVELKKRCTSVNEEKTISEIRKDSSPQGLVEAQAWRIDSQGLIELVGSEPDEIEGLDSFECVTK